MFKLHTTNSHDDDDDDENIVAQLSFFPNAVYKLISAQYGLQWLVSSFANTLWGGEPYQLINHDIMYTT